MKNKIVKTFEEHTENLNISGVSDSKLQKLQEWLRIRIEQLSFDDTIDQTEWKCNKREKDVLKFIRDTFL